MENEYAEIMETDSCGLVDIGGGVHVEKVVLSRLHSHCHNLPTKFARGLLKHVFTEDELRVKSLYGRGSNAHKGAPAKEHRQLARLGGSSFREVATGVMKAIMTHTVQRLYSLHGKKGKKAFLTTRLCKVATAPRQLLLLALHPPPAPSPGTSPDETAQDMGCDEADSPPPPPRSPSPPCTPGPSVPPTPQGPLAKKPRQDHVRAQIDGFLGHLKSTEESREKWRKECQSMEEERLMTEERQRQECCPILDESLVLQCEMFITFRIHTRKQSRAAHVVSGSSESDSDSLSARSELKDMREKMKMRRSKAAEIKEERDFLGERFHLAKSIVIRGEAAS
ncbi:hypothetical protein HPB52_024870 [Rhipicephalus sanguineus]|uniref:BEN domain-containing protein n=1 Tax=Rhipicephalus sanguineus TaxID=34632 RepID=A0A9D4TCS2_RHISA|nr:hypothetical protein HPB52_025667 [Rhipicephalus sanguineus]KAH7986557.1 hypothetical protein HPB52_024870 [Rhipicephalus sanguineus]